MAHVGSAFLHPVFPRRGAFLWMKRRELISSDSTAAPCKVRKREGVCVNHSVMYDFLQHHGL